VAFTKYYQSRRDSELSATIVTILSIALIFATVALLPIDIFLVSSTVDPSTGLKWSWADEDTVYWMLFSVKIMYFGKRFDRFDHLDKLFTGFSSVLWIYYGFYLFSYSFRILLL
jgi:hypothetical protein